MLEYKLGRIDIMPERLNYDGTIPYRAPHEFVTSVHGNVVVMHVEVAGSRHELRYAVGLDNNMMAGSGSLYTTNGLLVLGDACTEDAGIPSYAGEYFGRQLLFLSELQIDLDDRIINSFWDRFKVNTIISSSSNLS